MRTTRCTPPGWPARSSRRYAAGLDGVASWNCAPNTLASSSRSRTRLMPVAGVPTTTRVRLPRTMIRDSCCSVHGETRCPATLRRASSIDSLVGVVRQCRLNKSSSIWAADPSNRSTLLDRSRHPHDRSDRKFGHIGELPRTTRLIGIVASQTLHAQRPTPMPVAAPTAPRDTENPPRAVSALLWPHRGPRLVGPARSHHWWAPPGRIKNRMMILTPFHKGHRQPRPKSAD